MDSQGKQIRTENKESFQAEVSETTGNLALPLQSPS